VARADTTGQVALGGREVVPLPQHRREQRLVARLGVDVRDPGSEVEGAHSVADDPSRIADGLGVLVVVEIEATAGERPEPAPPGERVREPQVASLARLAIELREHDLDLGMAVGASRGVVAEHVVDQIGKAASDGEEGAVARRPRGCDSRLDQMPRAIEFVAHLQVGPAPGGIDHLAPAVQISVGFLGGRAPTRAPRATCRRPSR
jgi:hypothetical protein